MNQKIIIEACALAAKYRIKAIAKDRESKKTKWDFHRGMLAGEAVAYRNACEDITFALRLNRIVNETNQEFSYLFEVKK